MENRMFFICKDDEVSKGLARKFSEEAKPGSIIPLTKEELEAYKDFQVVSGVVGESGLIEVKPNTSYLMTIDSNKTNLDDCIKFLEIASEIKSTISFIRTKGE
jgi:hypothetical protein